MSTETRGQAPGTVRASLYVSLPCGEFVDLPKEVFVTMLLGSHEYILACNQAVAMQVVIRHSLDEMYSISWDIWSAKVLPAVMDLKSRHMRMNGNDVVAFMKDL